MNENTLTILSLIWGEVSSKKYGKEKELSFSFSDIVPSLEGLDDPLYGGWARANVKTFVDLGFAKSVGKDGDFIIFKKRIPGKAEFYNSFLSKEQKELFKKIESAEIVFYQENASSKTPCPTNKDSSLMFIYYFLAIPRKKFPFRLSYRVLSAKEAFCYNWFLRKKIFANDRSFDYKTLVRKVVNTKDFAVKELQESETDTPVPEKQNDFFDDYGNYHPEYGDNSQENQGGFGYSIIDPIVDEEDEENAYDFFNFHDS